MFHHAFKAGKGRTNNGNRYVDPVPGRVEDTRILYMILLVFPDIVSSFYIFLIFAEKLFPYSQNQQKKL